VLDAIRELDYSPDAAARNIKRNVTRRVTVVLPTVNDPCFAMAYAGMERVLSAAGCLIGLYTTSEVPDKERAILDLLRSQRDDGIIIATCRPGSQELAGQIERSGAKIIFLERLPSRCNSSFVGFMNRESMRDLVGRLVSEGCRNIAVFAGPTDYSSESDCVAGYTDALGSAGLAIEPSFVVRTELDKENSFGAAMRLMQSSNLPDAVVATSSPVLEGVIEAMHLSSHYHGWKLRLAVLGEESWTTSARPGTVRVPRRAFRLGETAATLILEAIGNPGFFEPRRILIPNAEVPEGPGPGLSERAMPVKADHDRVSPVQPRGVERAARRPIRIAMLEGSALDATYLLLGDFTRRTGLEAEIDAFNYEDIYATISGGRYDVVQVDIPWLDEVIGAGRLENLDAFIGGDPAAISHFVPGVLDTWGRRNGSIWSLPYIFGSQLLYYRKDLFDDPATKRRFHQRFGVGLAPPKTWKEFNVIARFFTRSFTDDSPVAWGTTLGASYFSAAVNEYLPRKWAYEEGLGADEALSDYGSVKALENYVESFRYASPGSVDNSWDEQLIQFSRGDTAMMILYMAHATNLTNRAKSSVVGKVGCEIVPGRSPVLGGWSLGIASDSDMKAESFEFIRWITCEELAIPHTLLGGATSSVNLYRSSELLTVYPWLPKALESFPLSRKREVPRTVRGQAIPEREYEKILGRAVHSAVAGTMTPEEALEEADRELARG
jgi:multiple sugar transport system substrate-binding protein